MNENLFQYKFRVLNHNHRYLKHRFNYEQYKLKLKKTKGFCFHCKKYIGLKSLTVNHIKPSSKNFSMKYFINNINFVCSYCNKKIGNREKIRFINTGNINIYDKAKTKRR